MIPYIQDRNGNVYEFYGTLKQKKNYEKELQRTIQAEMFSKLTNEEINEIEKAKSNGLNENNNEILKKAVFRVDVEEINNNVNKKYIINMLKDKYYNVDFENIVNELYEDYGEEQINERFGKILEIVFTQLGNNENYKELPAWGIE